MKKLFFILLLFVPFLVRGQELHSEKFAPGMEGARSGLDFFNRDETPAQPGPDAAMGKIGRRQNYFGSFSSLHFAFSWIGRGSFILDQGGSQEGMSNGNITWMNTQLNLHDQLTMTHLSQTGVQLKSPPKTNF